MQRDTMAETFIPIEAIGGRAPATQPPAEYDIPELVEVDNGEFMPRRLMVVTRYDCVYSCDHCFFYSNPNTNVRMDEVDVVMSIELGSMLGARDMIFTGGEAMLDPEGIADNVDFAQGMGLTPMVQTAYMGDTRDEVRRNADLLRDAGLRTIISTVSPYHRDSKPASIDMPYEDYMAMLIDEVTKARLGMEFKLPWDLAGVEGAQDLFQDIWQILLGKGAQNVTRMAAGLIRPGTELIALNGENVALMPAPIIAVGNARAHGLETEDWDKSLLYMCPIQHLENHTEGMITVYPDGNVARCCSAEKGADFGFGNVRTHSAEDIKRNVERSTFVSVNTDRILGLAHQVLRKEFPHLLPPGGAKQACEVCSPLVSHEGPKKRVAELLGIPDLFATPEPMGY